MKQKFINYKDYSSEDVNENTAYFVFDPNWNDYGNSMRYNVFLKDCICNKGYRILVLDENYDFVNENSLLEIKSVEDLKEKGYKFWGFAEDLDFYDNLGKKYDSKNIKLFLQTMNDITIIKNGIDDLENIDKMKSESESVYFNFDTKKSELIDYGLLRVGEDTYDLARFCNKINIKFECLVSNEESGKDKKEFEKFFRKFINGEYRKDTSTTKKIKQIICRLKSVDDFLSSYTDDEIVKFVGMIISDTNYYLEISKLAPKKLGEPDQEIIEKICDIQEILRVKETPDCLGQYTSLGTLDFILSKSIFDSRKECKAETLMSNDKFCPSVRLTNGNQLNDPMEGKVLFSVLGIDSVEYENTMNYLASATIAKDNLPMWKQYGDDATGIFTVFDSEFCEELINHNYIFKICYLDPETGKVTVANSSPEETNRIEDDIKFLKHRIKDKKADSKDNSSILQKWSRYMDNLKFLFKKSEYSYEKEYRILVNQQNFSKIEPNIMNGKILGYRLYTYIYEEDEKKLPVKYNEIMIGPKSIKDINYIAEYIKLLDKNIKVTSSKINYR